MNNYYIFHTFIFCNFHFITYLIMYNLITYQLIDKKNQYFYNFKVINVLTHIFVKRRVIAQICIIYTQILVTRDMSINKQ